MQANFGRRESTVVATVLALVMGFSCSRARANGLIYYADEFSTLTVGPLGSVPQGGWTGFAAGGGHVPEIVAVNNKKQIRLSLPAGVGPLLGLKESRVVHTFAEPIYLQGTAFLRISCDLTFDVDGDGSRHNFYFDFDAVPNKFLPDAQIRQDTGYLQMVRHWGAPTPPLFIHSNGPWRMVWDFDLVTDTVRTYAVVEQDMVFIVNDNLPVQLSSIIGDQAGEDGDGNPQTLDHLSFALVSDNWSGPADSVHIRNLRIEGSQDCWPCQCECCLPGGCVVTSRINCFAAGGQILPDGQSCEETACEAACCYGPLNNCNLASTEACLQSGGRPMEGQSCWEDECIAACCTPGGCVEATDTACQALGGIPGFGAYCDEAGNSCPWGGCCYGDGSCAITSLPGCTDGRWLGYESDCFSCYPSVLFSFGSQVLLTGRAEYPAGENASNNDFYLVPGDATSSYEGSGSTSSGVLFGNASSSGHILNSRHEGTHFEVDLAGSWMQANPQGVGSFQVAPEPSLKLMLQHPMAFRGVMADGVWSLAAIEGAIEGEPEHGTLSAGSYDFYFMLSAGIGEGEVASEFSESISLEFVACGVTPACTTACRLPWDWFEDCLGGPASQVACPEADCDGDGDVDLKDFVGLQGVLQR